ncbi:hypothetical protein [Ramlibacter tataouinensis]|uniref:hypothetical protein n=1 Tax=Ramlibacter tataouinensis TaxID=94132 RepID=UPI0011AE3D0E|nr:hypothetical protein [Ramlibacter tataouinensis]
MTQEKIGERRMHRSVTAIVVCLLAQAAFFAQSAHSQCVDAAAPFRPGLTQWRSPADLPSPAQVGPQPARGFIASAAAGTRDEVAGARQAAAHEGTDHPRRGGTTMLLAALALMSGIALRRYGAPGP